MGAAARKFHAAVESSRASSVVQRAEGDTQDSGRRLQLFSARWTKIFTLGYSATAGAADFGPRAGNWRFIPRGAILARVFGSVS